MSKEEEPTETFSLVLMLPSLLLVALEEELLPLTESFQTISSSKELQSLPSVVISSLTEVSVAMVPSVLELASMDLPLESVLVPRSLMDPLFWTVLKMLVRHSKVSMELLLEPLSTEEFLLSKDSEDLVSDSEDLEDVVSDSEDSEDVVSDSEDVVSDSEDVVSDSEEFMDVVMDSDGEQDHQYLICEPVK